jgi:hypothetical protein
VIDVHHHAAKGVVAVTNDLADGETGGVNLGHEVLLRLCG